MKWLFHYVSYIRAFWKIWLQYINGYRVITSSMDLELYTTLMIISYTAKHLEPLPQYMDQDTACLLSVYLPKRSGATDEFKEALDLLDATLGLYGLDNDVYILGDLNADLGTEGGPQACTPANEHGRILLQYLHR